MRLWNWLAPTTVTRWVRAVAWLNLIGNVVIIGTGGAVRLTGSGLGCTSWPLCTEGTADWHSIVEFSNRGVGALLGVLGILAVVSVWRLRRARPDLWAHAWVLLAGVVAEGLLGMLSVYLDLDAVLVGVHFGLSAILIGVATSYLLRASRARARRVLAIPAWMYGLTHLTTLVLALVIVGGVVTTAHGPHSGDAAVERDQSAWDVFVHVHAYLGYALVALLIVLLVAGFAARSARFAWSVLALLVLVGIQIGVGILQADIGLPPLLVGVHMVLAALAVVLGVLVVDAAREDSALVRA